MKKIGFYFTFKYYLNAWKDDKIENRYSKLHGNFVMKHRSKKCLVCVCVCIKKCHHENWTVCQVFLDLINLNFAKSASLQFKTFYLKNADLIFLQSCLSSCDSESKCKEILRNSAIFDHFSGMKNLSERIAKLKGKYNFRTRWKPFQVENPNA